MMYLYIKKMNNDYPVHYIIHQRNKSHGLDSEDYNLPEDTKLFIIPDAATNDAEQCNKLIDSGIDIIILDHHIGEERAKNNKAIIVNNQLSNGYYNKNLCGAGVVYRFLQALDEEMWNEYADDFIDLVAVGNVADIMDLRSSETRYFVNKGIQDGFSNKMLQTIFQSQNYSTHGVLNSHNIAFYVSPLVNALIRVGSFEERDMMMRAFIDSGESFEYKKRNGDIIQETIQERVVRLAKNAKSRQDTAKKKILTNVMRNVDLSKKVIVSVVDNSEDGLLGVGAMSIADTLSKPTILVKQGTFDGVESYRGSIRNFHNSPISDFRQFLLDTGCVDWASGHDNACGVQIPIDGLDALNNAIAEKLQDVDMSKVFYVDFEVFQEQLTPDIIYNLCKYDDMWCTGVEQPLIAIKHIHVKREDIVVRGVDGNTVAFIINGVEYIQFRLTDADDLYNFINDWSQEPDDEIIINTVGKCSINTFNNESVPQYIIEACDIVEECKGGD